MDKASSVHASWVDPLGHDPIERSRRIGAIRERRYRESPNSDLNILLFAYDEVVAERDTLAGGRAMAAEKVQYGSAGGARPEAVGVDGDPREVGDDLDAFVARRQAANPGFAGLLRRATRRRQTRV